MLELERLASGFLPCQVRAVDDATGLDHLLCPPREIKACLWYLAMSKSVDDALQVWFIFFVLLELERLASGFWPC